MQVAQKLRTAGSMKTVHLYTTTESMKTVHLTTESMKTVHLTTGSMKAVHLDLLPVFLLLELLTKLHKLAIFYYIKIKLAWCV